MGSQNSENHFLWGAATSAHQIEGNHHHNDWHLWEQSGRVEGGVHSGVACDHRKRFQEDLRLAREIGLNSYRFSVEWSWLEPEPGKWNKSAEDFYQDVLSACEKNNLTPMVTLHHFTSPAWFAESGGFAAQDAAKTFVNFATNCAKKFGARVPLWCTINEPVVLMIGGYLASFMPPGVWAPKTAPQVLAHLFESHVLAYRSLHTHLKKRTGPWRNHPLMVGFAHNMLDFIPERKWHPLEVAAAKIIHRLYNMAWLEAVTGRTQNFGLYGFLTRPQTYKPALGKKNTDFIGVNYYTKGYIRWRPKMAQKFAPESSPFGVHHARSHEKRSDVGWAIHPQGLAKILKLAGRYHLPVFITENGIADKTDDRRVSYLHEHLKIVAQAVAEKIDIRGYYHWSLMDNFEWAYGFGPRFGLYEVNYENQNRTLRKSGSYFAKIIATHQGHLPPSENLLATAREE